MGEGASRNAGAAEDMPTSNGFRESCHQQRYGSTRVSKLPRAIQAAPKGIRFTMPEICC
jgi:hypothetical protein